VFVTIVLQTVCGHDDARGKSRAARGGGQLLTLFPFSRVVLRHNARRIARLDIVQV
jgi:hypothetical protein